MKTDKQTNRQTDKQHFNGKKTKRSKKLHYFFRCGLDHRLCAGLYGIIRQIYVIIAIIALGLYPREIIARLCAYNPHRPNSGPIAHLGHYKSFPAYVFPLGRGKV
jgi:hypothetical protein